VKSAEPQGFLQSSEEDAKCRLKEKMDKTAYNPDNPLGHASAAEIPVFQPHIGIDTLQAVTDAFRLGWLGMGSYTREFEEEVGRFLGLSERYVVATNTGTSALQLALLIAGVGRGDEVIVPSFNFVADHQAIVAVGAEPVFCDIREDTLGIDVEKAESLVGGKTKAILPLHYAGISADLDGIYALAERHGLRVIEDATHAFGTRHKGRAIGSFGDLACFSFDPVKVVTCIDGGAVVAGRPDDLERLHRLRLLGIDKDTVERYKNRRAWEYDVLGQGFRFHLSNINAGIGLSQLRRVNEFVANRRSSCRLYNRLLEGLSGVRLPCTDFTDVSPFIYYLRILRGRRESLIAHLRQKGIATGIHWIPVHKHTFFKDCRRGDLSMTERVGEEILTLPLHSFMATEVVERIANAIREFFS
jgi:dTDP-4-amino-4,6-dideoxygalactose transaminase